MSELSKYQSLVDEATKRLAGRPVLVRMREPYIQNVGGMAHKTRAGEAVIDISPDASETYSLKLLTHEAAHIRLQFSEMRAGDEWMLEPNSYTFTPGAREQLAASESESEADILGRDMYEYACKAGNNLEARLLALLKWMEPAYRAMIERAVQKAISETR